MATYLHPQDIVVVLKLVAHGDTSKRWTYAELGKDLVMSASQVFRSVERAEAARLLVAPSIPSSSDAKRKLPLTWMWPNRVHLKEFLIHGVKYSFPAQRGETDSRDSDGRGRPSIEPNDRSRLLPPAGLARSGRHVSGYFIYSSPQRCPASGHARSEPL